MRLQLSLSFWKLRFHPMGLQCRRITPQPQRLGTKLEPELQDFDLGLPAVGSKLCTEW